MTFGSLFAGIGGFDLGFERAGLRCVWQVEIDPYCRRVLEKHWPHVPRWDDVRTFTGDGYERPDVICGGFPCQDISNAGKRAGIEGERSGLWAEYARIIRLLRPRFVVVENVSALLVRGLGRVLGDLAACGYDAEWDCIPAAAVGAPHIRDRVFVVAYPAGGAGGPVGEAVPGGGDREVARPASRRGARRPGGRSCPPNDTTDPDHERREELHAPALAARAGQPHRIFTSGSVPDPEGERRGPWRAGRTIGTGAGQEDPAAVADAAGDPWRISDRNGSPDGDWWAVEPAVGRVANGVPARVDRLRGLGNAVVPQVAEWIGRRLMTAVEG